MLGSSAAFPKADIEMNADELKPHDMCAIAAATQRMPGFGFDTAGVVHHRHLQYASIVSRICASLIDGIVTGIAALLILLGLPIVDQATSGTPGNLAGSASFLIVLAAILAFLWLYNVSQETSGAQATLGKRLMGIQVANLSGDPITVSQSTIRFIAKLIPGANPLLGLICLVANLFCLAVNSSKNRTGHDLLAGTVVIKRS